MFTEVFFTFQELLEVSVWVYTSQVKHITPWRSSLWGRSSSWTKWSTLRTRGTSCSSSTIPSFSHWPGPAETKTTSTSYSPTWVKPERLWSTWHHGQHYAGLWWRALLLPQVLRQVQPGYDTVLHHRDHHCHHLPPLSQHHLQVVSQLLTSSPCVDDICEISGTWSQRTFCWTSPATQW